MQHLTLLQNLLTKSHAIEHKKRRESVLKAVDSLVHGGKLSLTSIGRNRQDKIQPRSKNSGIPNAMSNLTNLVINKFVSILLRSGSLSIVMFVISFHLISY